MVSSKDKLTDGEKAKMRVLDKAKNLFNDILVSFYIVFLFTSKYR